jgi:purine-binding chemotaxis protein CheW
VASDDLKVRQRDALIAQALSTAQRPGASYGNLTNARETAGSSRASIAALQSQLAQLTQSRPESSAPTVPPAPVLGEQYLVFWLLGLECALKAQYIQGVERLMDVTPVPNVAAWVRGVINLRGSIASVVDLRTFLDMEQLPYNPRTRLLSVQYNEMVICLIVDGVSDMVPIPDTAITSVSVRQTAVPRWALPYAAGSALLDTRAIVLLDAARLLLSEKMQHYEAVD